MNKLDLLIEEFQKEIRNKLEENNQTTKFAKLFEDFMMTIDEKASSFILRTDEDKDHIGSIFFNDSDSMQKQTTKIINYFIDGRFLCQNKLEDLFKEFCRHHFLPNETSRILIPFTNKASYETISKVFDDKENSNRFLQPTCEHIEDFLKDEGVEGLDADSQQITIGWEFKLEDIL